MAYELNRRHFLQASMGAAAASVPMMAGGSALAQAAKVRWASLTPGFTVLVTEFIRHHKLDQKNGFTLGTPTSYTSVPTYYSDFDVGNYDVCIGSWDTFAVRYVGAVPIKYVCTITTGDMINIMSSSKGSLKSIDDVAGKVLAAPQSTGTYRMARAVLKEFHKIDLETAAKVQNVTNPAASVTLLRAGAAQAALTWEPNVSNAIAEDPNLQVLFNVGASYTKATGESLPYFGVAARRELLESDPKIGARIDGVFRDCIAGILADVPSAVQIVGERTGFKPAVLAEAINSKRLSFKYSSMTDPAARKATQTAIDFCVRNSLIASTPDEGFFFKG
ncbi:MAG TPA: PhnD/SsuA/transferrin family substrate-binding protein [Xanthobacteraceae bacterium]|nr:PhnD/SsuA/transferrin family substrate-binding protein [Xanthobacteraceae bacterium]